MATSFSEKPDFLALFKKALDYLMQSMIKLGQAFLELDGIGVDAFIIGFILIGIRKIRTKMDLHMGSHVAETHEEQESMERTQKNIK